MQKEKLIVALDTDDLQRAQKLIKDLSPAVGVFKVGLQAFSSFGPELVNHITKTGTKVFLDLKLYDIPNTVAKAVEQIVKMDVSMITVHAHGGVKMMEAAVNAARQTASSLNKPKPIILGVTVLTSMDEKDLKDLGSSRQIKDQVIHLGQMALKAGCDGVVCSPQEIGLIRQACGKDCLIIVPGIRPKGASTDDQKRIATPEEAIKNGADYIVVGRPITQADDPLAAARGILE